MLTRPYPGAATLNDATGRDAVICRGAALAEWLERVLSATATETQAIESSNEFRIIRAQLALVSAYREYPEDA